MFDLKAVQEKLVKADKITPVNPTDKEADKKQENSGLDTGDVSSVDLLGSIW